MDYLSRTVSAFAPCVAVAIGWTVICELFRWSWKRPILSRFSPGSSRRLRGECLPCPLFMPSSLVLGSRSFHLFRKLIGNNLVKSGKLKKTIFLPHLKWRKTGLERACHSRHPCRHRVRHVGLCDRPWRAVRLARCLHVCLCVCLWRPLTRQLFSYSPIAKYSLTLSGGYFLSDMIVCVKLQNYYPEAAHYMVHHVVSICGIVLSLRDQGQLEFVVTHLLSVRGMTGVTLSWLWVLLRVLF